MVLRFQAEQAGGDAAWHAPASSAAASTHELYLSDRETGVKSALQSALATLLEQEYLPDNPAYFLASVLMAYNDRAVVWSMTDQAILREMDSSTPLVHDASRLICRLGHSSEACGLPHVIRCIDATGLDALAHVLIHNLPNAFCSSSAPVQSSDQSSIVRTMCSLQGNALSYAPARQLFPRLRIRTDVLVTSTSFEDAVGALASQILRDARALQQLPANCFVAVRATKPVLLEAAEDAEQADLAGLPNASHSRLTGAQVEADTAAFVDMVKQALLSDMVCFWPL